MSKRAIFISAFVVFVLAAAPAFARVSVRLDPSFGSDGAVEGKFGSAYWPTAFASLQPQPDGSLLAGRSEGGEVSESIRRYNPDGSLDPSFSPQRKTPEVEAVQADGKVLRAMNGALERFEPDGTPDPTFGTRPFGTAKLSDAPGFRIERIVPLASGKILVGGSVFVEVAETSEGAGYSYVEQVAVARFEDDGRLDAGFGHGGVIKLKSDAGVAGERLLGLAPRSEEGAEVIVLDALPGQFGEARAHSGSTIVGLGPSGHLDSGYGSAGVVRLGSAAVLSFHALSGDRLLVAGDRWGSPVATAPEVRESDVFLTRYTASGQPDPSFGAGDGSAAVDVAGFDLLGAMLVEADGSVVLGGAAGAIGAANCTRFEDFCPETPFLARFTPQGVLDQGFGSAGLLSLNGLSWPYGFFTGGVGVKALATRPGGGIFAAGGSGPAAFIVALRDSGKLDPSFGSGGVVEEREPKRSTAAADALVVDKRGRLLVAGGTDAGLIGRAPEGALFRYLPDGELDLGFGEGRGYVRLPGSDSDLALGADGSTFVLSRERFLTVTKLSEDGRFEASFGEEGTVELPSVVPIHWRGRLGYLYVRPVSIVPLPDGRVLVAGTASKNESRLVLFRLRIDGSLDPSFGSGGVAIRPFGPAGRCVVNQMVRQRDGRLLFAGQVEPRPNEPPRSEALAVMRLLPNGEKDRSFGRDGLVVKRIGRRSYASALAVQGRRIVVAGRSMGHAEVRETLLRLLPDGRLDRTFGRRGIASSRVSRKPGGFSNRPHQILFSHRGILVLRDSSGDQLVAFSNAGRRRRTYTVARGLEGSRVTRAPFGALQGGRLVLGWEVFHSLVNSFELQRWQIGGRF